MQTLLMAFPRGSLISSSLNSYIFGISMNLILPSSPPVTINFWKGQMSKQLTLVLCMLSNEKMLSTLLSICWTRLTGTVCFWAWSLWLISRRWALESYLISFNLVWMSLWSKKCFWKSRSNSTDC